MSPVASRLASLLLGGLAWASAPRQATADETTAPTSAARLEVEASSACASRSELIARVAARAPRVRFVQDSGDLHITARFSAAPGGAVIGDVTFTAADAKPSARRVRADSCPEATDALALIIAMTLDPTATRRSSGSSETAAMPSHGPSAEAPSESPSLTSSPSSQEPQPEVGAKARSHRGVSFGLHVAGQSFLGPAPQVMPGAAAYAVVELERGSLWSPSVWLGATHAWQSGVRAQGGTAAFRLSAVSFDVCPLRVRLAPVRLRPCGSASIGRFSAKGSETINPAAESHRPFWIVGGAAVASIDLFWRLEASARLAVGANLVRDSFEFAPRVFHTVSPITFAGSLGVGMRFR
jgi:hypothetical protein